MNTSVSAVLFTSKTLANGEHPLMLRLTKNRKLKYVSLHLSLAPQYWDASKGRPRRHCPDREKIIALIERKINEYEQQIIDFKTNQRDYTLHTLVDKASAKVVRQTVGEYLSAYIQRLNGENRIGNAMTFTHLKTALLRCFGSLDFYFIDIDHDFLRKFEMWLRTQAHYSDNSIGIRFRSLRALYNQAISDNLIKKANYPFDTFKVSRFKEATAKRAISKEDIMRLVNLDVRTLTKYPKPFLALSKDLFLFSYLGCGINLTDMLHLKYCDLTGDRVTFNRQKTGKLITFRLQPAAVYILRKYMKAEHNSDDYIFPCLKRTIHVTAEQQYARVKRVTKLVNRYLKMIGEYLKFPIPLTTYVARHSFATVLKRSGVSTSIISESLGHSSEKITQIYLDSFENSQIDEAMSNLL